ncbi:MAG TPA: PHP domain-containing protein [Solirubrobacteraceae bacterium]|nr:PHP domain-containing protein [Solirubrobacteraceae bacterium]
MAGPLTIAHVTPYAWEVPHEVNVLVDRVADELHARGHRVLIVAPARDQEVVRESRALMRRGPDALFAVDEPRVVAVGEVLPELPTASRRRAPGLPVDVARTVEELLQDTPIDVVHVHEPFALSTAAAALRHSRSLNVGTFHAPAERLVSMQAARRIVELLFGRLDARIASYRSTANLIGRSFPADYRVVLPGADAVPARVERGDAVRIVFTDEEERGALRVFLRALRALDPAAPWEAVVMTPRGAMPSLRVPERLRGRVRFDAPGPLVDADIVVAASNGTGPAPGVVLRAVAADAVPLASSLAVYEELLADGDRGLLFPCGEPEALAAQIGRLVANDGLRERLRAGGRDLASQLGWDRVAGDYERVYEELVSRRRETTGNPELARRMRGRARVDVDLHMHTDHSPDCATPVEVLLRTARQQGLAAIAVTDHNEVSGAFEALEKAHRFGVKVIVGEEVKTASQGEGIGLFLKEKIPRGLSLEETVAEIKRQGGVVYVPHPFDRLHAVPDYEHLLGILDDVDVLEIYNPRVAIGSFNEEAERFAAKYRILAAAGSDSHVAQGLGSVRVRMPDFDGPEEFLEGLREAEIVTKPSSLLYVQALKFLETKATPAGARRAVRDRRVRKATRNG